MMYALNPKNYINYIIQDKKIKENIFKNYKLNFKTFKLQIFLTKKLNLNFQKKKSLKILKRYFFTFV